MFYVFVCSFGPLFLLYWVISAAGGSRNGCRFCCCWRFEEWVSFLLKTTPQRAQPTELRACRCSENKLGACRDCQSYPMGPNGAKNTVKTGKTENTVKSGKTVI